MNYTVAPRDAVRPMRGKENRKQYFGSSKKDEPGHCKPQWVSVQILNLAGTKTRPKLVRIRMPHNGYSYETETI